MSPIYGLALEALTEVIMYLNTREWTGLWISGDSRLQWMLSTGKAVREMVYKWRQTSNGVWPSQISKLEGLEAFSFIQGRLVTTHRLSALHLAALTRNLKKLELASIFAVEAFTALQLGNRPHFHQLERLDITFPAELVKFQFEFPKSLREIILRPLGVSRLCLALNQLPLGLTRLECTVESLEIDNSEFPSTLRSLVIDFEGIVSRWPCLFRHLPAEIEKLSIPGCSDGITIEDWAALSSLKFLIRLELDISGPFSVEQARLIPRSVEELILHNINDVMSVEWCIDIMRALPQKIRKLEGIWNSLEEFSPEVARNMPRTLETVNWIEIAPEVVAYLPDSFLEVNLCWGDFTAIQSWHSKLQNLFLPYLPNLLLDKLPATLQRLTVEEIDLSVELIERLPRMLSLLTVNALNPMIDVELQLKAFPRSLTVLEAYPITQHVPALCTSGSSRFLPRSLNSLRLGCLDFSESKMAEWILGLPRNLITIRISIKDVQPPVFASFDTLTALRFLWIDVLKTPTGGWSQHLNLLSLPRNLVSVSLFDLELGYRLPTDITNDTFKGAPRNLETLSFPSSPLVNIECLHHLPNLHALSLGSQAPLWFPRP